MNILQLVRIASHAVEERTTTQSNITQGRIAERIVIKKKRKQYNDGIVKLPRQNIRVPTVHELDDYINPNIQLQPFDNKGITKFSTIDTSVYDEQIKIIS